VVLCVIALSADDSYVTKLHKEATELHKEIKKSDSLKVIQAYKNKILPLIIFT